MRLSFSQIQQIDALPEKLLKLILKKYRNICLITTEFIDKLSNILSLYGCLLVFHQNVLISMANLYFWHT